MGFDYLGTDFDPLAVQAQRERYPALRLAVADARTLVQDLRSQDLKHDLGGGAPREEEGYPPRPPDSAFDSSFDLAFDLVFDKGTADALLLFERPQEAVGAYLDQVAQLLDGPKKEEEGGSVVKAVKPRLDGRKPGRERGVMAVVSCLRSSGGVLDGSGPPRIIEQATARGWELLTHATLESDVGAAGSGEGARSYDLCLLSPP